MEEQPVTQITTAQKQHREFDGCKYMFHFRLIKHKGVPNMTVTALIFPVAKTAKTIGTNGLAFRACTSLKKNGKQSEIASENYVGHFYDCITFNNNIIKIITESATKKCGVDIEGYAESNNWIDKEGKEHVNVVIKIMGAKLHEKTTNPTDCPF